MNKIRWLLTALVRRRNGTRVNKGLLLPLLLLGVALGLVPDAHASHFRYGSISWTTGSSTTINFTVQNAFRRDGYPSCINTTTMTSTSCTGPGGFPGVGDVIAEFTGFTVFDPGDGSGTIGSSLGPLLYLVTSIDPANNWLFGLALDPASLPGPPTDTVINHTYPSVGNFTAFIDSCCRISAAVAPNYHMNNPDGGYRVETLVNVSTTNSSPTTVMPPIVTCPISAVCSFIVPAADPNGDPLTYRLSTPTEASSSAPTANWLATSCGTTFCQPGPPFSTFAASINSTTGVYTWNTTGAQLAPAGPNNTLYSTQVTIEDRDAAGNVKSKIAVDFLIQLVPAVGHPPQFDQPPTPTCGSTLTVVAGSILTFIVQASDSDLMDIVTLNVVGLPPGATMSPPLPTSGNPVSSTFSWTPTSVQVGTYVVTFTATDTTGQSALCPLTIVVQSKPPSLPGRMTGGGYIVDKSVGRVSHGFELHCDVNQPPNHLEVNWGKGNNFHLNNLTTALCTLDPSVGGPNPPPAGFNKYEGTGTGTCNGLPATAKWTFTDAGEPGKNNDSMTIDINGGCSLSVSGKLAGGDHQAHNP